MQPTRPGRPDPRAQAQQAQLAASLAGALDGVEGQSQRTDHERNATGG